MNHVVVVRYIAALVRYLGPGDSLVGVVQT